MSTAGLRFTESHEWVRVDGEHAEIGLSDYAQHELGDIVFVELPEEGAAVSAGDVLATVESVKSVSEVYSPVTGEIVEVNGDLEDSPELVNSDAYGEGWLVKLRLEDPGEVDQLMSDDEYEAHTKG